MESQLRRLTYKQVYDNFEQYWKIFPVWGLYTPSHRGKTAPLVNKAIYETVYRHLNLTSEYVNWPVVVERMLLPEDLIRWIASYDFRLKPDIPLSRLVTLMKPRQFMHRKQLEEIGELAPAIKLQPGSRLVGIALQEITHPSITVEDISIARSRFQPKTTDRDTQRLTSYEIAIQQLCHPQNGDIESNRDKVIILLWELGARDALPVDLTNVPTSVICQYLNRYSQALIARKQLLP